jgi:hypothetical protein
MKKSPLRKKGKTKISAIQRKIWELCKQIIRKKYPNSCYTCGRTGLSGSNHHTGHLWAKAALGSYLKYDLRVLRPQCYNCNINRGGMGADFYKRMLNEIGKEEMEKLERDRQVIVNAYKHYIKILKEYERIYAELNSLKDGKH